MAASEKYRPPYFLLDHVLWIAVHFFLNGTVPLLFVWMLFKYPVSSLDCFSVDTPFCSHFLWTTIHFCLNFYVDKPFDITHFFHFWWISQVCGKHFLYFRRNKFTMVRSFCLDFCQLPWEISLLLQLHKFLLSFRKLPFSVSLENDNLLHSKPLLSWLMYLFVLRCDGWGGRFLFFTIKNLAAP